MENPEFALGLVVCTQRPVVVAHVDEANSFEQQKSMVKRVILEFAIEHGTDGTCFINEVRKVPNRWQWCQTSTIAKTSPLVDDDSRL